MNRRDGRKAAWLAVALWLTACICARASAAVAEREADKALAQAWQEAQGADWADPRVALAGDKAAGYAPFPD